MKFKLHLVRESFRGDEDEAKEFMKIGFAFVIHKMEHSKYLFKSDISYDLDEEVKVEKEFDNLEEFINFVKKYGPITIEEDTIYIINN